MASLLADNHFFLFKLLSKISLVMVFSKNLYAIGSVASLQLAKTLK
jgi:hypothetical protein